MGFKGGPPLGGDADGVVDGAADGVVDGAVDGAVDGTADGVVDGVADGDAVVGLRVGANVGIALKASDAVHSTLQAQGHFAKSSAISTSVCGIMKSKEEIDKTLAMSTKYEVECHDQTMVHKYMHVSNHAALPTSPPSLELLTKLMTANILQFNGPARTFSQNRSMLSLPT